MAPRATNNPRQMRSKSCGCAKCMEKYPPEKHGERNRRRDCTGSWQARYRNPAGEQRAKNYPTKKEAVAFLDEVRTSVRQRTYSDPTRGEITLAAWWEKWWPAQPKKRVQTTNRKLSNWRAHIEPRWGAWRLCDLEYIELQRWINQEVKGYHTRKKVVELLNMMLRAAVRDGRRIPVNPAADIEIEAPPQKHPDDLRPPSREQCALIRQHCDVWYRQLLVVLEETGLRWGEATGLRWGCVDLEAKHVKVKEVLNEDKGKIFRQPAPKTERGFRTVPLTPEAVAALQDMAVRFPVVSTITPIADDGRNLCPDELVFRGPRGGILTRHNFRRTWLPAIKAAGLAREVVSTETGRTEWWPHVHDLRHVFATRLKDAKVPEKDAQTVMGHDRGSRVTWIYQHAPEDVAAQVLLALAPPSEAPVRALRAV